MKEEIWEQEEEQHDEVEYWRARTKMASLELRRAVATRASQDDRSDDSQADSEDSQADSDDVHVDVADQRHSHKEDFVAKECLRSPKEREAHAEHEMPLQRRRPQESTFWRVVVCATVLDLVLVMVLSVVVLVTHPTMAETPFAANLTSVTLGTVAHELDDLLRPLARNLTGVLPCDAIGFTDEGVGLLTCPTGLRGVETALVVASVALLLGGIMLGYRRLTRPRPRACSPEVDPFV